MGFKTVEPKYTPGEKDWVYAILVNGRRVEVGERIPADATIVIQVGDGTRLPSDTLNNAASENEYEEVEEEVPTYEEDYEIIEVPIDEVQPEDEILSGDVAPSRPSQHSGE